MVLLSSSYIFSWAALPSPAARGLHLLQHAVSTSSDVTVEQKRPAGVVGPVEEEGRRGRRELGIPAHWPAMPWWGTVHRKRWRVGSLPSLLLSCCSRCRGASCRCCRCCCNPRHLHAPQRCLALPVLRLIKCEQGVPVLYRGRWECCCCRQRHSGHLDGVWQADTLQQSISISPPLSCV